MGKYAIVVALLVGLSNSAFARDDGRYANDTLKHWFDNLTRATAIAARSPMAFQSATLIGRRRTVTTACCYTANGSMCRTQQL